MTPLTPTDISKVLGVSINTVKKMLDNGLMEWYEIPTGEEKYPRRYIDPGELLRYVKKHKLPKKILDEAARIVKENA